MASSRFFTSLLLAAGAVAQLQLSLSSPARSNHVAARKRQVETGMHLPFDIYNWFYPYAVNLTVGTPGQSQSLALTFAYPESVLLERSVCSENGEERTGEYYYYSNCRSGAYDPSKSDTYKVYDGFSAVSRYYDTFSRVYGSRSVDGTLMTETVEVGGATVSSMGLLLANSTTVDTGFLGLGYTDSSNEFSLLEQLVNHGDIASEGFSLWAQEDSSDNTTGHILFGAVDKSKYVGPLSRLQASAWKELSSAPGYAVNVSAAETSNDTEQISQFENFYASISPTTMITNLPRNVALPILNMANATYESLYEMYVVDCNHTDSISGSFTLELGGEGGYSLEVNLRDLVVPPEIWTDTDIWNYGEDEPITMCMFGVQSVDQTYTFNHDSVEPWVIGNMALKKTYMAFDADNMEVALAPLRDDLSGSSDQEAFSTSGGAIPDSEAAGYQECFRGSCPDNNYGDDSGSNGNYGGDYYGDYYGDYVDETQRARRTAAIILGTVFGVLFLLIVGLTIWAVLRCRRIRKARAEAADATPMMQAPGPAGGVFFQPGAPPPLPAISTAAAGPVPRRPVPAHVPGSEEIRVQETRMLSPEPKANIDVTPAGTVSPESTPRVPEATMARGPSGQ
ncbi:aspartic peptidase domain-containing protein [Plectosphaerella plurivora]|uniref:Aspartic peptidase domain-containing protein n=1 Tax=Plectosphaerella plurivora TaxID=936078 RepID=A0A9P8VJP4_9PEZI|nr:aspartic peptidase domain-containing protein [Plectosphaerella plurivora]